MNRLETQRGPSSPRRVLQYIVRNHMQADAEIARFYADNGVTDDDLVISMIPIPFERRAGETAKDAYQRELREMAQ